MAARLRRLAIPTSRHAGLAPALCEAHSVARFLVGVNYWPRSSGISMWTRFDLTEVDEDFARIAALGLSVVRVFLTWDAFAPAPDTLAIEPLDDFVALLDAAYARGLRTIATLFFGHGSGANALPAWALDRSRRAAQPTLVGGGLSPWSAGDIYTGELLEAQRLLARALGERARDHAALFAWDLGGAFTRARAPASQADAEHWNAALAHDLRATSNVGATTSCSADDIAGPRALDLEPLAEAWKFPALDALAGSGAARLRELAHARGPGDDADVAPFLATALALRARRPAFVTAFGCANGNAPDLATPGVAAAFAQSSLDRLQRAGALGALWWRWSDDTAERRAVPPLDEHPSEAAFGIIAADGSEKPVARALAAFARERRSVVAREPSPFDERTLREEVERAFVAYREANHFNEEIS